MNLLGKVALITGGSSGIGLALARRMVAEGARVALVARTAKTLERAVAELSPDKAAAFPLDVNDRAAVAALPAAVLERFSSIDILVNNAGVNHRGPVLNWSADELVEIVETNLVSVIHLTRHVLPVLAASGAIINVSSIAGKIPYAEQATYCASKAGLRAFSMALHEELAPRGIRVLCVNPGPVDTDFFGDLKKVSNLTFSQPLSTPEELAYATLLALSEDRAELDYPMMSGKLATLGYLIPWFKRALRPMLERRGAINKAKLLRRRGLIAD